MQKNDFIRIKYTAKIKEGDIQFDNSDNMPLVVGANWVMKPIDDALLSMNVSEKKTVEIPPGEAYGPRSDKMVKTIPLAEFKKHGQKPVPGMVMNMDGKAGKILSVSGGRVRVDFNHPLAGKTLIYNIEIKKKIETPEEKIKTLINLYTQTDKAKINVVIKEEEVDIDIPPLINSSYLLLIISTSGY